MAAADSENPDAARAGGQRLDKWLWFARVTRSRTLAAKLVIEGHVRVDRERVGKPSAVVRPGDVLTIAIGDRVRVLRIVDRGVRRGPAAAARQLYDDLTPKAEDAAAHPATAAARERGAGRPTKHERRAIDRFTNER